MKEAADEGDSKGAKRARKLAEATAGQLIGQRSMTSFMRTGQSTVHRASAARETTSACTLLIFRSRPRFNPSFFRLSFRPNRARQLARH